MQNEAESNSLFVQLRSGQKPILLRLDLDLAHNFCAEVRNLQFTIPPTCNPFQETKEETTHGIYNVHVLCTEFIFLKKMEYVEYKKND